MTAKDIYSQFNQTSGANDAVWVHKDNPSDRLQFSSLDSGLTTNVCIVGAGISGISTAYELVNRGKNASCSKPAKSSLEKLVARAGTSPMRWTTTTSTSGRSTLGIECEYRRVPGYEISQFQNGDRSHDNDLGELRKEAALAKKLGLDVEFDEDLTIQGWDGKPDQRGGAVFGNQAAFHPTLYLSGILRWLSKQPNFNCFTHTRVVSVEEQGSAKVKVQTQNGHTVQCDYAVEATCIPLQKLSVVAEMAYMRTYAAAIRVPKGTVMDKINTQYKHIAQSDITDIEDLAADLGGVMKESPLNPVAVYKDENGKVTKMTALCPHMKGVVCWNAVEKSFDCPVHGSRFSATSLCVNGPAKSNLTPVQ
ncbi:hypothetical protein F5883DRAFT_721166 [Diaporthe sp. PMI_573]|nr:hypothetical protein F5883DRAFT_721166 [Diaporthaceae sp. PMI_573]